MNQSNASRHLLQLLQSALGRLKRQNSLTSIRSVAQQIQVSPSFLSKVFRGERSFPVKKISSLAKALRLDFHEVAEIHRLLLLSHESETLSDRTGIRSLSDKRSVPVDYETLGKDAYWMIEDWSHIAIHNLVTTDNFEQSTDWIARRLHLSKSKVEASIRRMIDDGYIILENGRYTKSQLKVRYPTERSQPVIRKFHEVMIKKAVDELRSGTTEQDFQQRLISGVTFAGDPERLAEAKRIIEEAMYKAAEHLAGGHCTEVFQLNLQLFKLTR